MKRFLQSFYGTLSVVFLLLLLVLGVSQMFLTMDSASDYISKVDQQLNLSLAHDMGVELKTAVEDTLNFEEIGHRIHYMMVMNPKIEIYLLDGAGNILAFFAEPGKEVKIDSVDLAPLQAFLSGTHSLPILGDDPRGSGRQKPFSAAQMSLGRLGDGYLYIVIGGHDYDSIADLLRDNYIFASIVRGLVLSVFTAGVAGLILFFFLTRRIRSMSTTVRKFKEGDYDQRIASTSNDEVGQLARTFNQMADTIEANIEELKHTDNLRRELIANVSHDLRTPLASIQGYIETILMKEEQLSAKQRHDYLNVILRDSENLNRMVHELFDLSKLEAQQITPNKELFSISELVQDATIKFKEKAREVQVELTTTHEKNAMMINGDIGLLERALGNLIDNAIDYTPEGGTVHVSVSANDKALRLSVQDSGVGIAEKDIPHVFDRYYRGGKKKTRRSTSTGLGLAIAQKIVELHDSKITVVSKDNRGSDFYFDLARAEVG
jgi:signal transduction histidine kinase